MTFVRYSNLCGAVLRNALKEPMRTQAAARNTVSVNLLSWHDGKAPQPSSGISTWFAFRVFSFCVCAYVCLIDFHRCFGDRLSVFCVVLFVANFSFFLSARSDAEKIQRAMSMEEK